MEISCLRVYFASLSLLYQSDKEGKWNFPSRWCWRMTLSSGRNYTYFLRESRTRWNSFPSFAGVLWVRKLRNVRVCEGEKKILQTHKWKAHNKCTICTNNSSGCCVILLVLNFEALLRVLWRLSQCEISDRIAAARAPFHQVSRRVHNSLPDFIRPS